MDRDDILRLKVDELKTKLSELKLNTIGRKSTLQDRLLDYYGVEEIETEEEENNEINEDTIIDNSARQGRNLDEASNESEEELGENNDNTSRSGKMFTLSDIRESLSYFDGSNRPEVEKWLEEFEDNAIAVNWDNLQKFIYAKQLIKGAAKIFIRGQPCINSWRKLKQALLDEFGEKVSAIEIHKKLQNRFKRNNESYLEYLYSLIEIGSIINIDEKSIIEYFVDGISDTPQNKCILYDANSISDLKLKIKAYEKIRQSKTTYDRISNTKYNFNQFNKKCIKCPHLKNHSSEECKKLNNLCFKCGKIGHKANNCRENINAEEVKPNQKPQRKYNSNSSPSYNSNRTHDNPHQTFNRSRENSHQIHSLPSNSQQHQTQFCRSTINLSVYVTIKGKVIKALFDTGSDLSLLIESDYESLGDVILFQQKTKIYGIGHGCLETLGYIIVAVTINNQSFNCTFHVVKNNDLMSQSLIGSDILSQVNVFISENGANFLLKRQPEPIEDVLFDHMLGTEDRCEDSFEAGKIFRSICVDNSVNENKELNIEHLNKHVGSQVLNLVNNYRTAKTKSPGIQMNIVLIDETPIRQRPRRLAIEDQRIVEKQIEEWLRLKIIRASHSEYTSPIVLVKKKDGTKRLCIDYRKLNNKVIRDNFPMVTIDDALAKLESAAIFTSMDLKNGFFHVPIEPNSTKYTSFVTHRGQYEFLRAPFGFTNSPAVFCRYVTAIFNELIIDGTVIIYMDDMVIPSRSIEENIQKLTQVLKIASEHGLEINWKKCQFIKEEITFLGYIIKKSSIQPSTEKAKAVKNFPQPKDVKSLQTFLGMTSYFRRFIQNYAVIAKPLTDLLAKNANFTFTEIEEISFQQLKSALSESSVLRIFNPQAKTEVHTDASKYGCGAALMQKDMETSNWHPVEFMSRKNKPYQQNYHSYDLEILAIVEALKKWRTYLLGIPFKIVTDCVAFTQTIKKQDVPARITRWVIFLQDFNYEIEHRPGTKLKHVDALSRVYCYMLSSSIKHRIMQAQDNDIWTKNLKEVVQKEKHPEFYVKHNILFKDYEKELLVIPRAMEYEIIETAHKQGHFSVRKTIDLIQKNFYIQNINEKATKVVRNCVQCLITNSKTGKKEGFLNPIDKSNQPLDTYHIDHVGPLEQTNKQYNYILTIIDAFSKFIWIYPTKSTGSNEVLQILQKQSNIFGNPNRIVTDRGTAFTSQAFADYCKDENINHVLTTTGVPRGNGQVERVHKIVLSLLTKLCVESPSKWYKHLGEIQKTLNNTPARSTQQSPFKILTGLPMKVKNIDNIKQLLTQEEINELNQNRNEIRQRAKENIFKIQKENVKTFNKNRKKETEYSVGDLVAIKRTQFGTKLKIKPKFLGPYKVMKKNQMGRYEVERIGEMEGPKKTTTIVENMKAWNRVFGTNTSQDSRM